MRLTWRKKGFSVHYDSSVGEQIDQLRKDVIRPSGGVGCGNGEVLLIVLASSCVGAAECELALEF